jgi:hypothetical protein
MTADHFEQLLNTFLDTRPFRVFTVELKTGQRYEVDSPRAIALQNGRAVFWAPGGIPVFFDHESAHTIFLAPANTDLRSGAA